MPSTYEIRLPFETDADPSLLLDIATQYLSIIADELESYGAEVVFTDEAEVAVCEREPIR